MDDETIGIMLIRARKRARLTQAEVAERAKISRSYISVIEIGSSPLTLKTVDKIDSWGVSDEERRLITAEIEQRGADRKGFNPEVKSLLREAFKFVAQQKIIDAAKDYSKAMDIPLDEVLMEAFEKKTKKL